MILRHSTKMKRNTYSSMARTIKKSPKPGLINHTTFQCYEDSKGIIDFTELKLINCARKSSSLERKLALRQLLQDYKACKVLVAWKNGEPVYVPVKDLQEAIHSE